ncbi:MAG TPA: GAF domain-containing protein [Xanthobacteraceae bacterium]
MKPAAAQEHSIPEEHEAPVPPSPSLEAFCAAFDAGRLGLWSWDLRSHRLSWSTDLKDVHGYREGSPWGTFSLAPDDIPAGGGAGLLGAMRETLQTLSPLRIEYRLPTPSGLDERWLETTITVIVDGGLPAQMLGMCREITERLRVNREVRIRARQQEALARLGERALTEGDLQKFFNEVVATVGEMLDTEFVKILELVPGDAELLLRAGMGWQQGLVGTATVSTGRDSQAGYTLASGRPVVSEDLAAETRFSDQPLLHTHGLVGGITTPIAGRDGRAYGVLGAHSAKRRKYHDYDVSFVEAVANVIAGGIQRQQLDQRHELMIRELRHRSGNLFSQLLALFSQTAKSSRSVADLVAKYEARVLALANAHRLVTEGGWKSASLNELLTTLLAPFLDRIELGGPNVFLEPDATFALSMAVHELLTNATKHGSLTTAGGRIELGWSVARTQQGLTLLFDWKEKGGPSPRRSRRPGFGSRLINMVIERQLNGRVQQAFTPQGVEVRLIVPLTHERWPGARPTAPIDLP